MLWYPRVKWITICATAVAVIGCTIWWFSTGGDQHQLFDYLVYTGIGSMCLGALSMAGSSEAWYSEHHYTIESQDRNLYEMLIGLPLALVPVFAGMLLLFALFVFHMLTS